MLYHWVPQLITAPLAIQDQAKVAFYNLCAEPVTTVSFALAWGAFGTEAARPLLSIAYFGFGAVFMLRLLMTCEYSQLTENSAHRTVPAGPDLSEKLPP